MTRTPEQNFAHVRKWAKENPEKRAAQMRRHNARTGNARIKRWKESNRERHLLTKRASEAVRKACIAGTLVRPDRCQECGKETRPQAAHYDYSRMLDVRWLCQRCHSIWDHERPKTRSTVEV